MISPVFLIGYMACGKTTLGRALGLATGMRFIDLDEYIEERQGCSVAEIFSAEGEDGFRRIESEALLEVARMKRVIVACGGGTPCFGRNMEVMEAAGVTVWLRASVERTVARLLEAGAARPLISGVSAAELPRFVERHCAARMPWYAKARYQFCSDFLEDEEQVATSVARFLLLIDERPL